MKKISFCLLLNTTVVASLSLYACEYSSTPFTQLVAAVPIENKRWVEDSITKYPEILWLADQRVRKTEEGHEILSGTYSEQLFGQKYIEFDRTMMTIHCLKLILDGGNQAYRMFTADQPVAVRLSRESFQTLHSQGKQLCQSAWGGLSELQIVQTMETALVLADMGKSEQARELFRPYGISAPDHDDFHGEAMRVLQKHPALCPSFAKLPLSGQRLLIQTANLAHYGHITHLEGGSEMFTTLKKSRFAEQDPILLAFDLFVHICDVSGALGHINHQSSLVYTEPAHLSLQAVRNALELLADAQNSEMDAYNAYLKVRASWLGLNPIDPLDRVLTRVGAMLRLYTTKEGEILKQAMLLLDATTKSHIALQLDVRKKEEFVLRTPTYMPAVFVNLSNHVNLSSSREKRLTQAITIGLPFIARVLEKHRALVAKGEIDSSIPLCFNKIAGVAKINPALLNGEFSIDEEGNVFLTAEQSGEVS